MTGPEHYKEAERLANVIANEMEQEREYPFNANITMARAHVHAMLALAAATALHVPAGLPDKDWQAWYAAASEGRR